jgi:hypothetical protein
MTISGVQHVIESFVDVQAPAAFVWNEVTEVDIGSFRHPLYLRALGVPQPLKASVLAPGVGGARVAHFSNGLRFAQDLTEWRPNLGYAFTFRADDGFRVGWLLDLSRGPFRLLSGAYRLRPSGAGIHLVLSTRYSLSGRAAPLLRWPVRTVLLLFQRHLLSGIRRNAERRVAGR